MRRREIEAAFKQTTPVRTLQQGVEKSPFIVDKRVANRNDPHAIVTYRRQELPYLLTRPRDNGHNCAIAKTPKSYRGLPEGKVVVRQDRPEPQLGAEKAQQEVLDDGEPVWVVVPAGVPAAAAVACRRGVKSANG